MNDSHFQATRLLSLQSRQPAVYKGIMTLLYKVEGLDFVMGIFIDFVNSMETALDIYYIFSQSYCEKVGLEED